ncbi:DUF2493 domain-containing protein [Sphingomonas sp. ASV193]|uniref:DUF2493 domain-containing protein n=1 Tax=Sphingomonas sp. ASV193 TaxID=3144405 RepID=UPI0032E85351
MRTTIAMQIAQLELGHLNCADLEPTSLDPPNAEASAQTLSAVWSDLFALFPDTVLELDTEELAWGMVNLFHRAAAKRAAALDRATDEVRLLVAEADGSEVHAGKLEEQVVRAQRAEASMLALESLREIAADLYSHETGHSWRPTGGSRLNHGVGLTSAVVDARAFLQARREANRKALMPEGTPVVFAGGRLSFPTTDDAKAVASSVWATLDKVCERVGDLVLVHGGDLKGLDRIASSWAERRHIPQLVFGLDRRLGTRAGFRRNEQMLVLKPRYVVAFPGSGVLERLVIEAKRLGIAVVDRRGPLGTHPKAAQPIAPTPR